MTVWYPRHYVEITVRHRATNQPYTERYWSDRGNITVDVVHPATGAIVRRTFIGAGTLIEIGDIYATSNLTVQDTNVVLHGLQDRIGNLLYFYEPKFGQFVWWEGRLDPNTRRQEAPAQLKFVGKIEDMVEVIPKEGEEGSVTLTVSSNLSELKRGRTLMRADEDQKLRHEGDNFFQDVDLAPNWQGHWGGKPPPIGTGGRPGEGSNR